MAPDDDRPAPVHVTHHLKGLHFPARKRDLIAQAKRNGAGRDVVARMDDMAEDDFASIAEFMQVFGEAGRSH